MAPVARPASRRSSKLDMLPRNLCRLTLSDTLRATWLETPGSIQFRQHLLDELLGLDDFDQKTLTIDVALLIEGNIHQDARLIRGLDGEAMQIVCEGLGIDLAHFFRGRLDHVDREIAFDAVVIGNVIVLLDELFPERLDQFDRCVSREPDMAARAVGGV